MQFVVWATDHGDALLLRQDVREAHRARLRHPGQHPVRVLMAGPTLDETTNTMNGTLLVVEAHSADAVRAFVLDDPYQRHGVYREVQIRPWLCGLGPLAEPDPDFVETPTNGDHDGD